MNNRREYILGYGIDLLTMNEALDFIGKKIINNEGAHIVTINPEIIEAGEKNDELSDILKNAELIIPDGVGIKLALKIKGINQNAIPGIDFARNLVNVCAENEYPIAMVGAQEEVINRAIENIKKETPNVNIVYKHNGYFKDDDKIINDILATNPKVILVAMGAPKQEFFINKLKSQKNDIILIGVGGSFDVWSGYTKRAPKTWQKLGLEWLYRTLKEPKRFKRIFPTLPMFIFKVIIEDIQTVKDTDEWHD